MEERKQRRTFATYPINKRRAKAVKSQRISAHCPRRFSAFLSFFSLCGKVLFFFFYTFTLERCLQRSCSLVKTGKNVGSTTEDGCFPLAYDLCKKKKEGEFGLFFIVVFYYCFFSFLSSFFIHVIELSSSYFALSVF